MTDRPDKLVVLSWALIVLASVMLLVSISLAIDASFAERQSLTAAILAVWSALPGFGVLILLMWRIK